MGEIMKRALLTVMLSMAAGHTCAADVEVIRASLQVSNLRYEVIDLMPEDGVDPTVTFGRMAGFSGPSTQAYIGAYDSEHVSYLYQNSAIVDGSFFESDRYVASIQGNSQSIGPNWFSQNVVAYSSDVQSFLGGVVANKGDTNDMSTENSFANYGLAITLGANTAIRIRGDYEQNVAFNLTPLLSTPEWQRLDDAGHELNLTASFYTKLHDPFLSGQPSFEIFDGAYSTYAAGQAVEFGLQTPLYSPIDLTYSNSESAPVEHVVIFRSELSTSAYSVLRAVPEPSTYVLMALGLVGIGAVVRRSRPATQA
jgi:hypothetical protein